MFERRRARKRMAAAEVLSASTPDGTVVRVSGVVRNAGMHLRTPTTGRACVAFSVRVFQISHREGGVAPFDCVELVPFAVETDELGRVMIDSQFAELVVPEHRVERMDDVSWTEFCDTRALSPTAVGIERPVMVGDVVTVLGTSARRVAAPGREAGFRDAPVQLVVGGDFDHPLLILDEAID